MLIGVMGANVTEFTGKVLCEQADSVNWYDTSGSIKISGKYNTLSISKALMKRMGGKFSQLSSLRPNNKISVSSNGAVSVPGVGDGRSPRCPRGSGGFVSVALPMPNVL